MVRHVILWKLKENLSMEEKDHVRQNAKEHLEALVGVVPGLIELHIRTSPLASSNTDLMLDALLKDEESLKAYAVHPKHVEAAGTFIKPYAEVRSCFDYTV